MPIVTTSRTVVGKSQSTLVDCGMYPTARRTRAKGCPKNSEVPVSGFTSPSIALISVDLPAPFGPTIPITTPCGTRKSTPRSTGSARYATERFSVAQASAAFGSMAAERSVTGAVTVTPFPGLRRRPGRCG